ncbi:hypothetical protein lerEdw1_003106 [Lerista edwardsae]|nr:hypothetical protein lerEdw1_003106 [Lerista edwardsae]
MEPLGRLSVLLGIPEAPWPPTLSLQPQHPIYTQGEDVTLICSAPTVPSPAEYTFYEKRGLRVFEVQPKGHNHTFQLDGTTVGTFHCAYQTLEPGQDMQSPRSNSVSVVRIAPVLSFQPQFPVYIQGEEVALTCSAPKGPALAEYELYEDVGGQALNVHLSRYHTFRLKEKTTGMHSCTYCTLASGRKIRSQRSNSVFLAWRDPPPPPVLDVRPPPGAVYLGEPLLISCLTSSNNPEKRYHFYKDGVEMDSSNEGYPRRSNESGDPSPDATLRIPQANSSHSGEFACSYEEDMNGRWVPSPHSQKVDIRVQPRGLSGLVLMYVRLAFVLLIPTILLVYYCHQKRKKGQEVFRPQESRKEIEFMNRGNFEPQKAALQLQSEAGFQRQETLEEESLLYCEMQAQPTHRLQAGDVTRVSYREIQFQPIHKAAK